MLRARPLLRAASPETALWKRTVASTAGFDTTIILIFHPNVSYILEPQRLCSSQDYVSTMDSQPIIEDGQGDSDSRNAVASRRDYLLGIGLLLLVVLLWTSSNFITQVSHIIRSFIVRLTTAVLGFIRRWL